MAKFFKMKGRPYFVDSHRKPSVRVIAFLHTPRGNRSRFYQSTRIDKKEGMSDEEVAQIASQLCEMEAARTYRSKLSQGYTIGEVLKYPTMEPISMIMPC